MEDCELVNAIATATAQVISLSLSFYFVSFFCHSRIAVSLHFFLTFILLCKCVPIHALGFVFFFFWLKGII
jgi:hypothetical protein